MLKEYLVGIDIGTTGVKTILFDYDGNALCSGYREYGCTYPKPNWVEQDIDLIVEKSIESVAEAVEKSSVDPRTIKAISLSSQRGCTILVDRHGKVIRPMISWQDNRTTPEVEDILGLMSRKEFFYKTLLPLSETWILTKLLWIRKNEPGTWDKIHKVAQIQDYVLKALGAEDNFIDLSDACFYCLWDPISFSWSDELLSLFKIPKEFLPIPKPSGTAVGKLSKAISDRTGIPTGTMLCVGAGDQNSAAVGAGIVKPGLLSVSLGTGGIVSTFLSEVKRDSEYQAMISPHAVRGGWQIEGYQAGAAGVYRWYRDEIALFEKENITGKSAYETLNAQISEIPPGAKGLLLLPFFASATSRWNPYARGTIMGLTFAHDHRCLARAFMEGITLEVKDIILQLLASGINVEHIHILGGPTKSEIWNQMQADMYNREVKTLANPDAAALGAAVFASVGSGIFKDTTEGVLKMVKVSKSYVPISKNVEVYNQMYDVYCKTYAGLTDSGAFTAISKLQETLA